MGETELEHKYYKKMWDKLWDEVEALKVGGVTSINPMIVLKYMNFIDTITAHELRIATLEAKLKVAGDK